PSGPSPPIRYTVPLRFVTAALVRAAGSAGPVDHGPYVPLSSLARKVVSVAAEPLLPPMYSRFVPTWAAAPAVRPSGSASSFGEACQGSTAPAGTGQGIEVEFSGGHRFTGDQPRIPRSIVRETMK